MVSLCMLTGLAEKYMTFCDFFLIISDADRENHQENMSVQ